MRLRAYQRVCDWLRSSWGAAAACHRCSLDRRAALTMQHAPGAEIPTSPRRRVGNKKAALK